MSSHASHNPQEVLIAQFSLYVHKSGLKPDSFYFCLQRVVYRTQCMAFISCVTWSVTKYKHGSCCAMCENTIRVHDKSVRLKAHTLFIERVL